jgi:hypothetical protein
MFGLYTVLTDTMDAARASEVAAGRDAAGQEGLLAGVFVMVEKATAAAGTFVFSTVMAYAGFISAKNVGTVQPEGVVGGITLAISVLPAIAAVLACLFLRSGSKLQAAGIAAPVVPVVAAALLVFIGLNPNPAQANPAQAGPTQPPAAARGIVVKRINSGTDGKSYIDEVTLPRAPGADPAALVARLYSTDVEIGSSPPGLLIDWHRVSTPRLLVILKGTMEIGTGDGRLHRLGPGDFALAADLTGQGHTSRTIGTEPVMAMTVRLPKDDPLRSRQSSCPDGMAAADCVANGLTIQHNGN